MTLSNSLYYIQTSSLEVSFCILLCLATVTQGLKRKNAHTHLLLPLDEHIHERSEITPPFFSGHLLPGSFVRVDSLGQHAGDGGSKPSPAYLWDPQFPPLSGPQLLFCKTRGLI